MANRDLILDGLAWAGISEPVRVAKISAMLVREFYGTYTDRMTKTRIKEAVRNTSPPYGRGKAICELVKAEFDRQYDIHKGRKTAQFEFNKWRKDKAYPATRLNNAYAHAFDRPTYSPHRGYPGSFADSWDIRTEWDKKEQERDKGDVCLALTHWREHVVCLIEGYDDNNKSIVTRLRKGEVVRTFLRDDSEDLVQAAISLGGPRVKAALAVGIRVTTDWVGRSTTVHYTNKQEVQLPWRSLRFVDSENEYGYIQKTGVNSLIWDHTEAD